MGLLVEYKELLLNEDRVDGAKLRQRIPLARLRPLPGGGGNSTKGGSVRGWKSFGGKLPVVGDAVHEYRAHRREKGSSA